MACRIGGDARDDDHSQGRSAGRSRGRGAFARRVHGFRGHIPDPDIITSTAFTGSLTGSLSAATTADLVSKPAGSTIRCTQFTVTGASIDNAGPSPKASGSIHAVSWAGCTFVEVGLACTFAAKGLPWAATISSTTTGSQLPVFSIADWTLTITCGGGLSICSYAAATVGGKITNGSPPKVSFDDKDKASFNDQLALYASGGLFGGACPDPANVLFTMTVTSNPSTKIASV